MTERIWQTIAALNGFIAIVMGAVAAHAVADAHLSSLGEHASFYQLLHAIVLLWLAGRNGKAATLARACMLSGIIFFCGSLYVKSLTGWAEATTLAPFGGVSFMAGWLAIAFIPRASSKP